MGIGDIYRCFILEKLKVKFWLYQPHGWCVLLLKYYSKSSHQGKLTKFCSCSAQSLLVPNIKFDPRQWENLNDIFYTCFQTLPLGRNYVIIT